MRRFYIEWMPAKVPIDVQEFKILCQKRLNETNKGNFLRFCKYKKKDVKKKLI